MKAFTTRSQRTLQPGRSSARILTALRQDLESGKYLPGQFIPTQRELSSAFSVSLDTVRRALHALQTEGLLVSHPRHGFCVQARINDPQTGCPLAFLDWNAGPVDAWGSFDRDVLAALRRAADARNWPVLPLSLANRKPQQIIAQLQQARAFGAILTTPDQVAVRAFRSLPLPSIMLDQWVVDAGIDSIMQDGHQAGILAARYLLERGCKRIAWYGFLDTEAHALARFGGAAAMLAAAGQPLTPERCYPSPRMREGDFLPSARSLFAGREKPDGVIALWCDNCHAAKRAADEKRLVMGTDYHLVGWTPQEWYEQKFRAGFRGGPVAPAITWSMQTMAETAISRMAERRANPALPPLQIKIPVTLRMA
jgi:DNA-binding LacI/PurR family transcriptional regulator